MRKPLAGIRRHLSYANVAATLALVMAMGGTAYAAATIGSADIIDGSIQGVDVKNGSLTSIDLKNETIQAADISAAAVGTSELFDGSVTADDIADGTITLADLGASARGVSVQPFVTVLPATQAGNPTVLATEGLITLHARCYTGGTAMVETATPGGQLLAGTWAATLDPGGPFEEYDFVTDSGFPTWGTSSQFRGWGVVTSTADQRALLVFLGVSVAADDSQCAFDGFAIGLR